MYCAILAVFWVYKLLEPRQEEPRPIRPIGDYSGLLGLLRPYSEDLAPLP